MVYFNSCFLAIIVDRQKSIFYLLLYVLTNFKQYKIKCCFNFWGFCAISHRCPSDVQVILGNGEAEGDAASVIGFKALYKVKYYYMPSQFGILSHWKSPMLSVLRRLRSTLLILLLARLICNPFRMCSTLMVQLDGLQSPFQPKWVCHSQRCHHRAVAFTSITWPLCSIFSNIETFSPAFALFCNW